MELPLADDDSSLIPLETPSAVPLVESTVESNPHDASELLLSVTSPLITESSVAAEDDGMVVPPQDPVPMIVVVDTSVSADVPSPPLPLDDNSQVDATKGSAFSTVQSADEVNKWETTLHSGSSLSPGKQSYSGSPPPAEETHAHPVSPPHLAADDFSGRSGICGTASVAVEATSAPSVDEMDTTMAVESASLAVVADDDEVVVQERPTSPCEMPGYVPSAPPPDGVVGEFAVPAVVADDDVDVVQDRASSPFEGPGYPASSLPLPSPPAPFVDDSSSEQHKEGFECHESNGLPSIDPTPSSSSPVVSKLSEAEDEILHAVERSSGAVEVPCLREIPSSPGAAELSPVNVSESVFAFLPLREEDVEQEDVLDEQPAKRAKTNGTVYSGSDAVAMILGQTAEIVLVLAGMAQMRAGRSPTSYERELATTAYQNLGILVSRVAPNNLVATESIERLIHEYNMKKMAQKRREDKAWVEALTEADALANAKAEAVAKAKAEAAARVQAEADELERIRQAMLKAAAPAANGSGKSSSSAGGLPLSSGQSAYRMSDLVQSPSLSMPPGPPPSSQGHVGSPVMLPVSKAGEVPVSETPHEKSMSVNGQSHTPASKPLGRPPKVRHRARKDPTAVTLFTPEFLNLMQNPASDPQKAQVTHKQLCLGVQQFIRDHIPPISQTLQALPPTYISTPYPCQVCKLIAQDTGSVLVCDSCDEVSHVKCVQPPSSKGASKGDWNCPKCLIASRGGKYPSKYGPIRRGSPNSVKLWPPHDTSEGNSEPASGVANGSVRGEGESNQDGRKMGSGHLKVQRKASLEIDTRAHQSRDDPSMGNLGSSPHLIVHLVNEPSPRTNPFSNSSHLLLKGDKRRPFPSGQSLSSAVQEIPSPKKPVDSVATDAKMQPQQELETVASDQNDCLKLAEADNNFEKGREKNDSQSAVDMVVEDAGQEARSSRATPARIEKPPARIKVIDRKKGAVDSGAVLPGKQAEVPLPIVMEWVGGIIRKVDGKVYYRACSVGGITFSVSDCALFRPETPDVPPYIARLQVLWEDVATCHKWVRVSWCYYPSDIPLAMGRPGTSAPAEVYESNHCDNNLVGSIQGPCYVLPSLKFHEETERRNALKKQGDSLEELPPIFLSRWMYDAPKGVFRALQE